jgi:hypothetical protein
MPKGYVVRHGPQSAPNAGGRKFDDRGAPASEALRTVVSYRHLWVSLDPRLLRLMPQRGTRLPGRYDLGAFSRRGDWNSTLRRRRYYFRGAEELLPLPVPIHALRQREDLRRHPHGPLCRSRAAVRIPGGRARTRRTAAPGGGAGRRAVRDAGSAGPAATPLFCRHFPDAATDSGSCASLVRRPKRTTSRCVTPGTGIPRENSPLL